MHRSNVFRDGPDGPRVHVMAERCPTCIFRPGNLMTLNPGTVKEMVDDCLKRDAGNIPCHHTLYRRDADQAICRGFWDGYADRIQLLQVADRLGMVTFDQIPDNT
jgi:hypothetical protein